jgi:hypothetical protein
MRELHPHTANTSATCGAKPVSLNSVGYVPELRAARGYIEGWVGLPDGESLMRAGGAEAGRGAEGRARAADLARTLGNTLRTLGTTLRTLGTTLPGTIRGGGSCVSAPHTRAESASVQHGRACVQEGACRNVTENHVCCVIG